MNINFFTSARKKEILAYDNFLYNFLLQTSTFMSWRCRVRGCGGSLRTNLEKNTILLKKQHSHEFQESEINKLIFNNKLKSQQLENIQFEFEQIVKD
ncbi:hypothetical protein COBT_000389, partial [Conglomerata obtusa]